MADLAGMMQAAAGAGSVETDEYFNQTTLLLHGDGTNGAQNNTFLDSSTNNFTITRVGNTTQGTFSPFSVEEGKWSNYFDGTGDYLTLASNAAFGYGTGDFTIEFFIYLKKLTASSFPIIFDQRSTGTEAVPTIYYNGGLFYYVSGANRITGGTLSTDTWHHIAVCRSGTSTKMFIDGTQTGSTYTDSTNYVTSIVSVGTYAPTPASFYTNAYYSNLRIVKGTALYTSDFTPSTAPLTAISGTSLLTCQSNRFVDNSTNNIAIPVNGDTSIQPFSPFAPSAAYDPAVNGGSGYFDGNVDAITIPSSSDFAFGTGDFTIEFWGYFTNIDDLDTIYNISGVAGTVQIFFVSGKLRYNNYLVAAVLDTATTIRKNEWNHYALVRSSGTTKWYINGVQDASVADSINWVNTGTLAIGRDTVYARDITGFLADWRVVKGSAVYTSAFTPPTAPLTAITNTKLLLNFTNAGIFDNTGKNNLETVGNAQVDTGTKKFGTGSLEFDGTGDYLTAPSSPQFTLSGDFTIEAWVYPNSTAANWPVFTLGDSATSTGLELFGGRLSLTWRVYSANAVKIDSSTAYASGAWVHLAVVRSSGVVTLYVNGTAEGSTWSTATTLSGGFLVGAELYSGSISATTNGFIDEFRITKGVARYTANFTPPTAAFLDQ